MMQPRQRQTGINEDRSPHRPVLRVEVFGMVGKPLTTSLSAGIPVLDVCRWLGHRNIQMTYAIYSHFVPSSLDSARSALDAEYETWSKTASKAAQPM
jgi:hypothetical protein